jgi:Na+-driven multidrug efflux pump
LEEFIVYFFLGVAVGGGWQGVVAYINLACYYGFGLPLGFIFGYLFRWGVKVKFSSVQNRLTTTK